jgi:1-acyl-sn-glycerol-3-phosphate acyltransferase
MNDSIPQASTWLNIKRTFLRGFVRLALRLLFKIKITGWENLPESGGYMISHNHVSIADPALVISNWPFHPEAVGAAELWSRSGQNFFVAGYETIPVSRGDYDRAMLMSLINVLKEGRALVLAPEGTRSHVPGLLRAQSGIGYIIDQAEVPVLPIGIVGATDAAIKEALQMKRPLIEMVIGEPFTMAKIESRGAERRRARQRNSDLVMLKIAELLPAEYHGVYANFDPDAPETD